MATLSERDPELSQILDIGLDMEETHGVNDRHHSNQSEELAINKIKESLMQLDEAYSGSSLLANLGPLEGSTGGVSAVASPGGAIMATAAPLFGNNNSSNAIASNQQQRGGGGGFLMPPQRTVLQQLQHMQQQLYDNRRMVIAHNGRQRHLHQQQDYRRMAIFHNVRHRQLQQQTISVAGLPSLLSSSVGTFSMAGGGGNNNNHLMVQSQQHHHQQQISTAPLLSNNNNSNAGFLIVQSPYDTMAQWTTGEVHSSVGSAEVTVISGGGGDGGSIGPQTVVAGQHAARLVSLNSGGGDVSTNLSNDQLQQYVLHHYGLLPVRS